MPHRLWDIRDKETPGQQRHMRVGRRIAFFLGVLSGSPVPGIDDRLWDARGNQACRHLLVGAAQDRQLQESPFDRGKATSQRHWRYTVRYDFQQRGLMVETTNKIGMGGSNLGQRFDLDISSINKKQIPFFG